MRTNFSKLPGMARPTRLTAVLAALLLAGLGAAVAGCGSRGSASASGHVRVLATTTQAADLVRHVGGDRVDVTQLLAPNADPHEYEVRPGDLKAVAKADVIVRSGGDVDTWLQDAIDGAGSSAPVLTLIDHVRRRDDDPHWWQDPRNVELAVPAIRDALVAADRGGASAYRAGADRYLAGVRALDAGVRRCIAGVPAAERKLVTTHDALGYYAARYGITVIGAVIPSLSTAGQPSAGDLAELTATIRRERVRTIFAESSVNAKVERAIARETGAKVGPPLWADTLGPKGSSGATYVASIASNTRALVAGFTGGARSCTIPG
jgi:ABC-type Zn uptake system ZnuABC Zn-binding protein ZnuA